MFFKKRSSWLIFSVSSNCFVSSSCNDLTDDNTRVVLGLGQTVGMTLGLGCSVGMTIAADAGMFFTAKLYLFGRSMFAKNCILRVWCVAFNRLFFPLEPVVNNT